MTGMLFALAMIQTAPASQTAPQPTPPVPRAPSKSPLPPPLPNSRVAPSGAPQTWVTNDDYPAAAIGEYQQGSVGFALDVEADGHVSRCTVTRSSGWPLLDTQTCALLRRRATFSPATDAQGVAIPSRWSSRFTWRLPEMPVSRRASWVSVISFLVNERGKISNCRVQSLGPVPPERTDPCAAARTMPAYYAALHGEGEGIRLITFVEMQQFETAPTPPYTPPAGQMLYRSESAITVDAKGFITGCDPTSTEQTADVGHIPCNPGIEYDPIPGGDEQVEHARYTIMWIRGSDAAAPTKSR